MKLDPATGMYRVALERVDWRHYTCCVQNFARVAFSRPQKRERASAAVAAAYESIREDAMLFVCEYLTDVFAYAAGVEPVRGEA